MAMEAALLAGELLRQGYGTRFSISSKEGRHNLVTEYDHKAEKMIIDFLGKNTPGSSFLAEESGVHGSSDIQWIIDPLDGTVNFAHGIPMFAVSIGALLHKKIVSGVVFQPMTHELFVAETGKGAFLNGSKIKVSSVGTLEDAILATGFPYDLAKNPSHCIEHFVDILRLGIPIRRLGSAAIDLAYTAAGRFDGFFEAKLAPWDIAAGKLILEEAGGVVTHWDGTTYDIFSQKTVLACTPRIHKPMTTLLSRPV
jgi:myo-inositol-1(or 4)-monophosphatase